jgi:outer membrane protein
MRTAAWFRIAASFLIAASFSIATAWAQTPPALTLSQAEAMAVQQHPQIAGARLNTQASAQVTREVKAGIYPQASVNATAVGSLSDSRIAAGFLNAGGLFSRVSAGVQLQQLVTDFGRTSNLVESSRAREQSLASTETFTRANILLAVDRAYFRALRSQALLRVANQTVASRQLVSDQVGELARNGLKSELDARFAAVNLADARLLAATAENEVREAFAELSNAMGLATPQTYQLMEAEIASSPEPDPAGLVTQALQNRQDLASMRFDLASARRLAEAERALKRPTISAAGVAGGTPAHEDRITNRYGAAGINVSIPVFNGSLFNARRTEAELRAEAASERVRDAEYRIGRDVNVAWLEANTAFQRIALTQQLLDQANLALDLAQSRYNLGLSSIVELGQAQLNQTSAEIQNLTSRYEFQSLSAVLRYQTGLLR